MLEDSPTDAPTREGDAGPEEAAAGAGSATTTAPKSAARKKSPATKTAAKKATTRKATSTRSSRQDAPPAAEAAEPVAEADRGTEPGQEASAPGVEQPEKPAKKAKAKKKSAAKKPLAAAASEDASVEPVATAETEPAAAETETAAPAVGLPVFQAPATAAPRRRTRAKAAPVEEPETEAGPGTEELEPGAEPAEGGEEEADDATPRRRRRRGGRRRRKPGEAVEGEADEASEASQQAGEQAPAEEAGGEAPTRRRRRRRRAGEEGAEGAEETNTVTRVRQPRTSEDQITAVTGSTRLEAKKQRRREGREAGRRRAPIVSEAEFLARRESVERVMVIRQREGLTQIAVLEDKVLVEHYVARESQTSLIGNVYLGRVQNVLPSMEAAFIDIGKGRNAVLYAGEVNWSALGHQEGTPRKIESVLTSGQTVLVQVTKDPVGHKGARLTSQISLAGRFLVYVPDGTTSGISRKLPDTERTRLKTLLKEIVPDTAGVIVRTAAEGASEEELTRDVERLTARWDDIERKAKGGAPQLLYGEPDLTLKVVRDLFTEDFTRLVIEGDDAWDTVQGYVAHVAPDLEVRMQRYQTPESGVGVFAAFRIDEQIAKGLDRKVWLPSGGSLVIDRTEAMTVVDVNTGKFTGSGGNLEETVTKNNLEAAEEIVRQLRLRDIGGIIVVDFIDMVLESNRDLVLRRLVECLGRDRTRHQVAEVTSLGLVQMTRKRIGTGLLEAFSHTCDQCGGRGVVVQDMPVEPRRSEEDPRRSSRRSRGGRGRGAEIGTAAAPTAKPIPTPKDLAAAARPVHEEPEAPAAAEEEQPAPAPVGEPPAVPQPSAVPQLVAAAVPAAIGAGEPLPAEPVATDQEKSGGGSPAEQPEPEAAEPAPEPVPPPVPEPVAVVSRTRRRSASRPAGPPGLGAVGEPPTSGVVEPGTAGLEPGTPDPGEEPHVEHVPIKKKGTRKR